MTARRLRNRYRRLLWAYPPGPRRAELLDTLLEAAPEGRNWPTLGERANLLRHGMRARLGRPGSRGVVAAAVLVSLAMGFLGAAVAHAIALTGAPALPQGAALAEIQDSLFPGLAPWAEQEGDTLTDLGRPTTVTEMLLHGHTADFSYATVTIGPGQRFIAGDYADWTDQAAARLVAAGWEVGELAAVGSTDPESGEAVPDGTWLRARRGDLTMELNTSTAAVDRPAGEFDVNAVIRRFPPRSATWTALGAGVPAAMLGWLIFGWASRRTDGADLRVRLLTREPLVVALAIISPLSLSGLAGLVSEALRLGAPARPFWAFTVTWGYGYALFALSLCLLALIVAVVAGWSRPAVAADRPA
jgi:hypothetical protein